MMNSAIQGLLAGRTPIESPLKPQAKGGEDFGKMLVNALEDVNGAQKDSVNLQQDLLTGRKPVEIHEVMIASEKASTAMQLTLAVRNKALEAFQEINRLPV